MSKIRHQDLIYQDNCVTVPHFFTPRAKAAQVRMQLASPAMIINAKNMMRCGIADLNINDHFRFETDHAKRVTGKTH